jgi:hypothetical protein
VTGGGALERVEARLAAGTYGASVLSGRPIPDERLEAFPLAELTVDEAAERDRNLGGKRKPESRIGPSRDPFRVFEDPAAQDDGLVEDEDSDDEPAPEANIGVRTTPRPNSAKGWPSCCAAVAWVVMPSTSRQRVVNWPVGG